MDSDDIQARKMEAVGQLTGGIAHDFNNLLTVVLGSLDMIQRSTGEARTKRLAGAALKAAERGARLTGQLLAFSRTRRLELRPTLVAPLIEGMRALISHTLGPSVQLVTKLDAGDVAVMADPNQLELAVLNMAINARDAMPRGGTLAIAAERRALAGDPELPDGEYLELSIADTGTGMAPETAARAFDAFFTTKEVGQGTGLGLSMVHSVAKRSGGAARIDTARGAGTRISLLLPRTASSAEEAPPQPQAAAAEAGRGAAILVIDDDEEVRRVLVDTLADLGHEVRSASNGPGGLEVLKRASFDLIVIDFAMPGMNGGEVAREVRRSRSDQKILFVTGYADTDAIDEAARDAPVLRKPFRAADIARAVEEALAG